MIDKKKLHYHCLQTVENRISDTLQLISDARDAANSDTKSSMGDKYETTREMMQIEINKLQGQLSDLHQMLLSLKVLESEKMTTEIAMGSIIETNKGIFYLSAALGKIIIDGVTVHLVSGVSPLGKAMLGKKAGDEITLNQMVYKISAVY